MISGGVLIVICSLLFFYQMKKDHVNRNVVILFFALAGMITGAWLIFDAILFSVI
ncbi:hypothetical protein [Jeotgalibacillus haloalkalitolerans]|uniref:DUF2759 domain-containing protein n=1 Tax=Jeotgalibacillus haloalkalitolerans TaxID=3104292 RepID=A0ABU5KKT1_9BACL|nr:hypothetical protein [Jeotgalibacillus sp. HH7-29]MDZ5711875.1 hypothetical protein [Jeotgalibacillus sp. HH7-29]